MTDSALNAVILLTIIDTLGFVPTFKKAYYYPFEEKLSFFIIMIVKDIFTIIALEEYSLTTLLFPITLDVTSIAFIVMVFIRRKVTSATS